MIQGTKNLNRIPNDKYYTSKELASYVVNKTKEIIGDDNITQYLEPSAGAGVFLDLLNKDYLCYDIEPEDDRITQQNYLELKLEYLQGRCIIGNPPFGEKGLLVKKFYEKSITLGDYIAFILPVSQLNNNVSLYKFDLIYSENLGKRMYSDREVHCCLNIYRRPNILNKRPTYDLDGIRLENHYRNFLTRGSKQKIITGEDYRIKCFGGSKETIGNECEYQDQYAFEICFFIEPNIKDKIIQRLKETNWGDIYPMVGTPVITQWQIKKYLGTIFPELKKKLNPLEGLNKRPKYELDGVDIKVWQRGLNKPQIEGEDLRMMAWGRNLNSISKYPDNYSYEFCYFIRPDYKDRIIEFLKETDFNEVFANKGNGKINRILVKKLIGDKFPELKL